MGTKYCFKCVVLQLPLLSSDRFYEAAVNLADGIRLQVPRSSTRVHNDRCHAPASCPVLGVSEMEGVGTGLELTLPGRRSSLLYITRPYQLDKFRTNS